MGERLEALKEFDADEADVEEPFRSLVGCMFFSLAKHTRPNRLNGVRASVRHSHAKKNKCGVESTFTSKYRIPFQKGKGNGVASCTWIRTMRIMARTGGLLLGG